MDTCTIFSVYYSTFDISDISNILKDLMGKPDTI